MSKDRRQDRDGNEDNEVLIPGGLHTDSSLVNQPPGTTRFVMTGVPETKEGDYGFLACEESNEKWYDLPTGFIGIVIFCSLYLLRISTGNPLDSGPKTTKSS